MTEQKTGMSARRGAVIGALVAGGLIVGGVTAGTMVADAAGTSTSAATPGYGAPNGQQGPGGPGGPVDESKSRHPDEKLLTGDTAAKVRAAALAKYPGAAVLRVETDSDGVYEAHLTRSDGTRVTVEVDKSFAVTGEEAAPAGGRGGPHGGGQGGPGGGQGQQGQQGQSGQSGQTQPPASSTD